MRLRSFLRSHALLVFLDVCVVALLRLVLPAMGLEHDSTVLVCIVAGIMLAVGLAWEWLRERSFVGALQHLGDVGQDAMDRASELPEPSYPEGQAAYGAVQNVLRSARQEVGRAQDESRDYRRYVETWVHEVKTPLAACNLMLENRHDPSMRPLARQIARVEAYVEQALYYARSFSVQRDYLIRACPLDELVRSAVRSRAPQLIEARMAVDLDGLRQPGGAMPEVLCDPKWMEFILGQLVDNAVRYRAEPARDGRDPRVEFDARVEDVGRADERVVLDVRDNGCGISAADLGRVFERGFTGANGRSHVRSTGMGLYLVSTLCQKMGLRADVSSLEGSWTCVTISFPQNRSRMV